MRKIPSELESPIDDYVLQFAETSGLMEWFYNWGFTPNILTTIGNIFRVLSIYFFYKGQRILFLITAFLGFVFDCFDGHYARQFNMTSNFGDFYDHISDLLYHMILMYVIYWSPKFQSLSYIAKLIIFLVMGILFFLFSMHMGCQEHFFDCDEQYANCSYTLDPLKKICRDKNWITWTKYFGTGTFTLALYLLAFWSI